MVKPWKMFLYQYKYQGMSTYVYRGGGTPFFPLHTYPEKSKQKNQNKMEWEAQRSVNMDETIRKAIEDVATDSKHGKPDEKEIFDYIYGLLHSRDYRARYLDFLKSDFPRIPYPKDSAEFWHLSSIGTKLRDLHLMDPTKVKFDLKAYTFRGKGDDIIERPKFNDGKVWINETQYFDSVPESAWDFYIGGYQPAQLWLKNRRGKTARLRKHQLLPKNNRRPSPNQNHYGRHKMEQTITNPGKSSFFSILCTAPQKNTTRSSSKASSNSSGISGPCSIKRIWVSFL